MELTPKPHAASNVSHPVRRMFLTLVILGFGLRAGYGIARYRNRLIESSGDSFVSAWDHDALEHVLIAKALLSGKGYIVDVPPANPQAPIRFVGQEALFKAPLYEFFLAATFALSGFSFKLLIPLQALLGGLTAGLMGVTSLRVFGSPNAGWIAGMAGSVHPILVNSASQPYSETLFFCLFAFAIWTFLRWLDTGHLRWAACCGVTIGLCTLTRENGLILLAAMGAATVFTIPRTKRVFVGYGIILVTAILAVVPWAIRNYAKFGVFVPVASIVGEDLSEGNNECVGQESIFTVYWAEGRCASVDLQRRALLEATPPAPRVPRAVRRDRISEHIAFQYISDHPATYIKLAFRRFWTTLLPFDPRGNQRLHERVGLLLYWLLLFPAGMTGMAIGLRTLDSGKLLLVALIVLNLMSIAAVLYWSDLRFRVSIDLPLGCFAGWAYAKFFQQLHNKWAGDWQT